MEYLSEIGVEWDETAITMTPIFEKTTCAPKYFLLRARLRKNMSAANYNPRNRP
ncbi:MAG TPA: hypothetical protein VFS88_04005 [Micavibrio sp.]|nr:hypothetical protein [Micavibrio sp.]